jgi:hypothetical protein
VPAWAPTDEPHVLRSSDVLVDVRYDAGSLRYRGTAAGAEEIRLPSAPKQVKLDGALQEAKLGGPVEIVPMPSGGALLTVRRSNAQGVTIEW